MMPNSSSSSFKSCPGDDIFPDYAVNWGSKNKVAWSKKEMNFGTSPKKETNETVIMIENNQTEVQSASEIESKSEEESKENKLTSGLLNDIAESFLF